MPFHWRAAFHKPDLLPRSSETPDTVPKHCGLKSKAMTTQRLGEPMRRLEKLFGWPPLHRETSRQAVCAVWGVQPQHAQHPAVALQTETALPRLPRQPTTGRQGCGSPPVRLSVSLAGLTCCSRFVMPTECGESAHPPGIINITNTTTRHHDHGLIIEKSTSRRQACQNCYPG